MNPVATVPACGGGPVCSSPSDVPWLSELQTSGTTAGGASTSVDVLYNSTGLADGTYTANLCVESNDPDAGPGNETDLVVVPVSLTVETPQVPSITLVKTVGTTVGVCSPDTAITVAAGTTVYYCYTVTNTGSVTFTTHDLSDDQLGTLLTGFAYSLAPGASTNFISSGTVVNETTTNVGTWTAHDATGAPTTASASATVTVEAGAPAITLTKTVGTVPGVCAATDAISVPAGTEVYYCYQAENTGDVTFEVHSLADNVLGQVLSNLPYTLAPGAFSPQVIVPRTINATTVNTATWTASSTTTFVDISATGTPLSLTDDSEANIVSPFPFTFFGATSTDLRVGNNGGILFGVTTGDLGLSNIALPAATGLPAPAILPFWDDMDDETGNVYWEVQGTAPNRTLIVEWYNRPHFNGIGAVSYEVILYETSNAVELRYLDTDFGDATLNAGLSATSGLQQNTTTAVQYSFNQPVLYGGFGVRFEPPAYAPQLLVYQATSTDSATVTALFPNIDVSPLSLTSTQVVGSTANQALNIANTGAADLTWQVSETQPDRPAGGVQPAPEPFFDVPDTVTSKEDCAAFENYPGREPAGYAEFCDANAQRVSGGTPESPTSTGYLINLRTPDRNLKQFTLNNFPGQTVVGAQAANIYGMDFNSTATTLYALNSTTNQLGTIDIATGVFTSIAACVPPAGASWTDLAIDPVTDLFYASTASNLYTLDLACTQTLVGPYGITSGIMIDLAVNASGQMYGHDIFTDSIYTINTTTGAATLVGATGLLANFAQGMDFDNEDGTLYIFLYQGSGANVYGTVNLATGTVTALATTNPTGEFEGATQTLGLCIPNDYSWFSLSPTSGTTAVGASTPVDAAFDSTGLACPQTYTAQLCVRSNDPDAPVGNGTGLVDVPVTLQRRARRRRSRRQDRRHHRGGAARRRRDHGADGHHRVLLRTPSPTPAT